MNDQRPKLRHISLIVSFLNGVLFTVILGIAVGRDGWDTRAVAFPVLGLALNFVLFLASTRQVRGVFRPNETESQSSKEA